MQLAVENLKLMRFSIPSPRATHFAVHKHPTFDVRSCTNADGRVVLSEVGSTRRNVAKLTRRSLAWFGAAIVAPGFVAALSWLGFSLSGYAYRKIELPSGPSVVSFQLRDSQELAAWRESQRLVFQMQFFGGLLSLLCTYS
jgi:hypothetical protein